MTDFHPEHTPCRVDRAEEREYPPQAPLNADGGGSILVLLGGLRNSESFALAVGTNTVGRLPDNDIVVAGPFVSRRHCAVLVYPNGHCEVHDLGSRHGVCVNGQPIAGLAPLKTGDVIGVGNRRLVLVAAAREVEPRSTG